MTTIVALRPVAALLLSAIVLAGCGEDSDPTSSSDNRDTSSSSSAGAADAAQENTSLILEDPYVKAADSGMTAAFGTLVNGGLKDVTVVSATSDITTMMELHETVADDSGAMAMQPKQGGFVIPAGGKHELSPGGDHLMIMDLTRPVAPGEDVTITLTLDDGSTVDVVATVKDVAGGEETYDPDGVDMDMDMGDQSESTPSR